MCGGLLEMDWKSGTGGEHRTTEHGVLVERARKFSTPYIDTHTNTHMHTLALFILSVQLHLKKLFEKTLYAKGIAIAVPCLEYTQSRISGEDTWWQ